MTSIRTFFYLFRKQSFALSWTEIILNNTWCTKKLHCLSIAPLPCGKLWSHDQPPSESCWLSRVNIKRLVVLFSYLTVQFADIWARHQTLPELLGSVPDQIEAGLLQEEGQEAQVAVQILEHNSSSLVLNILHRTQPNCMIIILFLFWGFICFFCNSLIQLNYCF